MDWTFAAPVTPKRYDLAAQLVQRGVEYQTRWKRRRDRRFRRRRLRFLTRHGGTGFKTGFKTFRTLELLYPGRIFTGEVGLIESIRFIQTNT